LLAKVIRALNGVVELASGALYGGRYFAHMQFLVSISNAACTVMSSQTRAALMTHFARIGNFADCAAKEGNQDRGVKLAGILAVAFLIDDLGHNIEIACMAYAIVTVLQLAFNVLAVRSLRLEDEADDAGGPEAEGHEERKVAEAAAKSKPKDD